MPFSADSRRGRRAADALRQVRQRGREDGEVLRLLREGLAGVPRTTHVDEIYGEFVAIDTALDRLEPGDLCLVLVDQVEEALAHLKQRIAGGAPAPLQTPPQAA